MEKEKKGEGEGETAGGRGGMVARIRGCQSNKSGGYI